MTAGCPTTRSRGRVRSNGCGSDRGLPTMTKPLTHQGDLAKLPRALAPLIERKQWCIYRWTPKPDGSWQKPPFIATHPDRHANIKDASTWTDYTTALAAVQTGHGDGISYVLTADDQIEASSSRSGSFHRILRSSGTAARQYRPSPYERSVCASSGRCARTDRRCCGRGP